MRRTIAVALMCCGLWAAQAQAQEAVNTRPSPLKTTSPHGAGLVGVRGAGLSGGFAHSGRASVREVSAVHSSSSIARRALEKLRPALARCAHAEPKLLGARTSASYTLTVGRHGKVMIITGGPRLKSASLNLCITRALKGAHLGRPDGEGVATVKARLELSRVVATGLGMSRATRPVLSTPDRQVGPVKRVPKLMIKQVIAAGRLQRPVVHRVVRRWGSRLRACYAQGLRRDSHLRGELRISFEILPNGNVTRLHWLPKTIESARVRQCAAGVFARMRFPKAERPTKTGVRIQLGDAR